jgi:GMP synthase (glutamine-hydrolysing)
MLEARGDFARMIREAIGDAWAGAYEVVDVRVAPFPEPRAAAAFVITGSAANVPTREPWIVATEAWLREVVAAGTPVFGICFGHQLLGQALGGEVRLNPRGREIGTARLERLADDPIFEGVPRELDASVTHVDTVAVLPPGAVALARSSHDDHHAVRFAERVYGVQFHPEFDDAIMRGYLETRREVVESEGLDAARLLAEIRPTPDGRRTLQNFVRRFVRG